MGGQFWIFVIVVGISVLSSVIGKMKEQAEINRAREAAKKRREEELRTGRSSQPAQQPQVRAQGGAPTARPGPSAPVPVPVPSREDRMREINARRQAELRELRERQARMRAERGGQTAPPQQRPSRKSPDVVRPGTPQRYPSEAPKRQRRAEQGSAATELYQRRLREREREIAQTREIELEAQRQEREKKRKRASERDEYQAYIPLGGKAPAPVVKKKLDESSLSGSVRGLLTGGTIESRRERLQQVFVLKEILDAPVSQRNRPPGF